MVDLKSGKYAVRAQNVSYIYPDGTEGVRNVSIEILEGERVALLGPNGCGKSTLILLLSGLINPTSGRVEILGREVNKKNSEFFRRNIGVLFQNPDDFLFNPTVKEELLYTPAQLGLPFEEAMDMVREYSEEFGIEKILEKPPFRLSGGEKKKVSLVCSIMLKPSLLFLDEPTANVDGKTRKKIIEIAEKIEGTVVLTTHELEIIPKMADRIVLMSMDKKIIADGDLELLEDYSLLESAGIL